jgi:hypothetical protein
MKHFFCLFLVAILSFLNVKGQSLQWANGAGSAGTDYAYAMDVDAAGNSYTIGTFTNTVDFDPGVGVQNLTAFGMKDIFILKLDASGNYLWVKRMGGTSDDQGNGIKVDPATGDVYTTGAFGSLVDFDPGSGTSYIQSNGGYDIFIQKLDTAGNFIWAKGIGGTSTDYSRSIALDLAGNIYTTGNYVDLVDFDPGAGTAMFYGNGNTFILKLSASGNFVWAKSTESNAPAQANDIAVDGNGNVYITGYFSPYGDFDPGPGTFTLTAVGSWDIFIVKLNPSGNFLWARSVGGSDVDQSFSLRLDVSGNIYVTGCFRTTVDFDPGVGVYNLTSSGDDDVFILKLNNAGQFQWAKRFGSSSSDCARSLAVDGSGNIYTTGQFDFTVDFDPDAGISNLTSAGGFDVFIHKLDGVGNFLSAMKMGGTLNDLGYTIAVSNNNFIYCAGLFSGTADFNPGIGTSNLTSVGGQDVFLVKLGQCSTTTSTISPTNCNNYTAPDSQVFSTSGTYIATIPNSLGCDSVITINLTINLPPNQPSAISGNTTVCEGSSNAYSTAPVPGATGYTWTLPGGWTGTSATNSITATAGASGGTVSVTANNACGSSTAQSLTVTVNTAPAQPGAISGNATVCSGSSNTYTVTAVPGATGYTWTLPGGWSGTSTTNSISTTASTTSGTITVTANNACGTSPSQTLTVTVSPDPIAAFSSSTNLLAAIFTDLSTGATSWAWDFGDGNTSTSQNPAHTYSSAGTYTVCLIATANGCSDTVCHPVTVIAVGVANSMDLAVSVYPNPSKGKFYVHTDQPLKGELSDMHGKVLLLLDLEAGTTTFDSQSYSDSIYFLRLRDAETQVCIKLVKFRD